MMRIVPVVTFALCAVLATCAESAPRHPEQKPTAAQQTAPADQRGTEQLPAVVKILPTPKTPEETAQDSRERKEKADSDWALVKLTAALAIVGALQLLVFGWQGIQLRNTVKASENEFNSTHRPKIRVKHLWLSNEIDQEQPIVVNLTCVNTGTAEAHLQQIGLKYFKVKEGSNLPIEPEIQAVRGLIGTNLPSGLNWTTENINNGTVLTQEQYSDIDERRSKLFCVGYVSYFDAANRMRITGFCRILVVPESVIHRHIGNYRFRRFRDPDYDYED